jgi:hypothetical protein
VKARQGKQFFFEKKNQKTFSTLGRGHFRNRHCERSEAIHLLGEGVE